MVPSEPVEPMIATGDAVAEVDHWIGDGDGVAALDEFAHEFAGVDRTFFRQAGY